MDGSTSYLLNPECRECAKRGREGVAVESPSCSPRFVDGPADSGGDRSTTTNREPLMTKKRDRERRAAAGAGRFTPSDDERLGYIAQQDTIRIGGLLGETAPGLDDHTQVTEAGGPRDGNPIPASPPPVKEMKDVMFHPQECRQRMFIRPGVVRDLAEQAVKDRLGHAYMAAYGSRGCIQDLRTLGDGSVLVHVSSGGNALAVQHALQGAGYVCVPGPVVEYGCTVLVCCPAMAPTRGSAG